MTKPKDRSNLIAEYKSGYYTVEALAKRHKITRGRIYQILKNRGIESHTPRTTPIKRDREPIIADYLRGDLQIKDLLAKHRITQRSLYKWLAQAGIPTRNQSITEKIENKVAKLYSRGLRIKDISEITDIQNQTVRNILIRKGLHETKKYNSMRDEWKKLYEDGESLYAIANKFGTNGPTVRQHLVKAGVSIRKSNNLKRTTEADRARIIDLMDSGMPAHEVAEIVGFSKVSVSSIWRKHKLQAMFNR